MAASAAEASPTRRSARSLAEPPSRRNSKDRAMTSDRVEGEQLQLRGWLRLSLQAGFDEVAAELQRRYKSRIEASRTQAPELNDWLRSEFEAEQAAIKKQLEDLTERLLHSVDTQAWLQALEPSTSDLLPGINIQRGGYRGSEIVCDMIAGGASKTKTKVRRHHSTSPMAATSPNFRSYSRSWTKPAPSLPALPQALFEEDVSQDQAFLELRSSSKRFSKGVPLPGTVPLEGKWQYTPYNGLDTETLVTPAIGAERTGHRLSPGGYFTVVEETQGEEQGQNIIFLHLENNQGWLFDRKPDGIMSTRCVAETRAPAYKDQDGRSKTKDLTWDSEEADLRRNATEDSATFHPPGFVVEGDVEEACVEQTPSDAKVIEKKSSTSQNTLMSWLEGKGPESDHVEGRRLSTKQDLAFVEDEAQSSLIKRRLAMLRGEDAGDGLKDDEPFGYCWLVEEVVSHPAFDLTFAFLIMVNSLIMALQVQYRGIQDGYDLSYPGSTRSAVDAWPKAVETFDVMEWLFAFAFSSELLFKVLAKRREFPKDYWNVFDMIIVVFWYVHKLGDASLPFPPMLLRLARLVRLLRLLRLVRKIQSFDSLYLMTTAIKGSASALAWSSVLLFVVQMMIALFLNEMLEPYMMNENEPLELRRQVYEYYGTFSRAIVTMFELTLANWIVPARVLSESVSEWYTLFTLSHQLIIGFAVVKVITGVFLHETFKVAATDDTIMVSEKERAIKLHTAKMKLLFEAADEDGNGLLDRAEFTKIVQDPAIQTWLAAMELDVSDAEVLYDLVGEGEDEMTAEQLVKGVSKLKGAARSIDMLMCVREMDKLKELMEELVDLMKKKQIDAPSVSAQGRSEGCDRGRMTTKQWLERQTKAEEEQAAREAEEEVRKSNKERQEAIQSQSEANARATKNNSHPTKIPGRNTKKLPMFGSMYNFVTSPTFDVTFACLIMLNSLIMAAEVQYHGYDTGYDIGYRTATQPAKDIMPGALTFFKGCELLFGCLFTLELGLKVIALKKEFFQDLWNYFDSIIVLFWAVDALGAASLPLDPMLLRLARLVRLLRLLRLVRTMQGFDSLYLLVTAIKGSLSALMWSAVLLFVIQMMIALFLNEMLQPFIMDTSQPQEIRQQVYRYFGTFSKAMLTMFEITLGNWIPVCRLLGENVNEFYVVFSIVHKCIIGFAVVMVLTGVFMQQTFKVAATDDTIMQMTSSRAIKIHTQKMKALFAAADQKGNGTLDRMEFKKIIDDKSVRTWLAAMDMHVENADKVFTLIAPPTEHEDEEAKITAEHLVRGVSKLKGKARSLDLRCLMRNHKQMVEELHNLAIKAGVK